MGSPFIGEIRMFGGNFAPAGWAMCNGRSMPISQNETLFNLIGTTYGGDGQSTFDLPDLRGRCPVHNGTLSGGGQTFVIGETGGVESVTLNANTTPLHNHLFMGSQNNATDTQPGQNVVPGNSQQVKIYSINAATQTLVASALSSVGGSQPHENMMPYLALTFIIALYGIYPNPN